MKLLLPCVLPPRDSFNLKIQNHFPFPIRSPVPLENRALWTRQLYRQTPSQKGFALENAFQRGKGAP